MKMEKILNLETKGYSTERFYSMTQQELSEMEIYYIEELKKATAHLDFIMKQLAKIRGQYQ
jgi:hypothetical protein